MLHDCDPSTFNAPEVGRRRTTGNGSDVSRGSQTQIVDHNGAYPPQAGVIGIQGSLSALPNPTEILEFPWPHSPATELRQRFAIVIEETYLGRPSVGNSDASP